MYSLEALLNSRGEESVTSGTCQWKPKTQSNSEPCEIKDVVIEKIKAPSNIVFYVLFCDRSLT